MMLPVEYEFKHHLPCGNQPRGWLEKTLCYTIVDIIVSYINKHQQDIQGSTMKYTTLWYSNVAIGNPLEMGVSIGKSPNKIVIQ